MLFRSSTPYPSTNKNNVSAPVEMDFYIGFKKELIAPGFASDVGVLQYFYPTAGLPGMKMARNTSVTTVGAGRQAAGVNPNTTEAYIAQNFTFGPVNGFVKVSYALTDIFGIYQSAGSYYPDLTVNYDTGMFGITLNGHVGYQKITNNSSTYNFSYTDWKLGATKDFGGGLTLGAFYVGTNAGTVAGSPVYATPQSANAGKGGAVVALTKTF